MKVSKKKLEELVREELDQVLMNEINAFHNAEGRFTSADDSTSYSLSSRAVKKNKVNPKYAGRGVMKGKYDPANPKSSYSTPSGSSSGKKSAGRQEVTGEPHSPKYRLKGHPKKYRETLDHLNSLIQEEEEDARFINIPRELLVRFIRTMGQLLDEIGFEDGSGEQWSN